MRKRLIILTIILIVVILLAFMLIPKPSLYNCFNHTQDIECSCFGLEFDYERRVFDGCLSKQMCMGYTSPCNDVPITNTELAEVD